MRVLIVEDETSSYKNLLSILAEVAPDTEVSGNTESVAETVRWLNENERLLARFRELSQTSSSWTST